MLTGVGMECTSQLRHYAGGVKISLIRLHSGMFVAAEEVEHNYLLIVGYAFFVASTSLIRSLCPLGE